MSPAAELLVLLVMLVGLVGVVVPVLPGLLLVEAAVVAWAWVGGGAARWSVALVLSVLFVAGKAATYVLPARSATAAGAPRRTLVAGAVGAAVGFFVIPVVGLVVGGVGGVFLAEHARLGSPGAAWRSTRAVLVGVGLAVLVELATALVMIAVWGVAALAT